MLTATRPALPTRPIRLAPRTRVVCCYSLFDAIFPACGLYDLTEGIYQGDNARTYEAAQRAQHDDLLDRAGCEPGSRLLDIGCGYGTLLARARERGIRGFGLTLSPPQMHFARRQGLDVRLLDYRHLNLSWEGAFDAVIANGSAEHFVQPQDALCGRADAIYREFFATVHRLLDPEMPDARLVTTVIHFERVPRPRDLLRSPRSFPRDSDEFHYCRLARSFGGWYPVPGQLERAAAAYFDLVDEVDGTDDYRRTSEEWLQRVRQTLYSRQVSRVLVSAFPTLVSQPGSLAAMLYTLLVTESWNWQFRGPSPPTRLYRQVWLKR